MMNELTQQGVSNEIEEPVNEASKTIKHNEFQNKADSIWSNLRYGIAMLAIIVLPPLIPGVSLPMVIVGYMSVVIIAYSLTCIWAIKNKLKPVDLNGRRRHKGH